MLQANLGREYLCGQSARPVAGRRFLPSYLLPTVARLVCSLFFTEYSYTARARRLSFGITVVVSTKALRCDALHESRRPDGQAIYVRNN